MKHRIVIGACAAGLLFAFQSAAFAAAANPPAYVTAAIADPHRPKTDTNRDADRTPAVMLGFSGVKPGDKVAELIPAGGYATRLLSAAVGPNGHIYSINLDTLNDNIKAQIKPVTDDPAYANVSVSNQVLGELKTPEPVDMVWTSQNYHDFHNFPGLDVTVFNQLVFDALKPGGTYLVLDHAAEPGSGVRDTATLHRIDAETVKKEVLAAGFVFVGASDLLHQADDPHAVKVFDPSVRGKTDQFILKFRKPKP